MFREKKPKKRREKEVIYVAKLDKLNFIIETKHMQMTNSNGQNP